MISSHVLDATTGRPAAGLRIELCHRDVAGTWHALSSATTDGDGRVAEFAGASEAGVYRLTFAVEEYLAGAPFYPEVVVTFRVTDPAERHHVPLLLSPFAYSTYRGS
ncbi:MAG: 5-hydroxyisourate hydrolase [Pseudonocardiales bacterium]|jgi:5-hydroxyisourate hydrolase|nr:5-hydroxyisourate hydrolase [Pseudonocardiales bacterium]